MKFKAWQPCIQMLNRRRVNRPHDQDLPLLQSKNLREMCNTGNGLSKSENDSVRRSIPDIPIFALPSFCHSLTDEADWIPSTFTILLNISSSAPMKSIKSPSNPHFWQQMCLKTGLPNQLMGVDKCKRYSTEKFTKENRVVLRVLFNHFISFWEGWRGRLFHPIKYD